MKTKKVLSILIFFILTTDIRAVLAQSIQDSLINELRYSSPQKLNIDSVLLFQGIEEIVTEALDSAAFPGCQILLAKGGEIFYYESFGYHTYNSLVKIKNTDIYDLASVTKTTATTLALMKLYDQGLFDLDKTMGEYFPQLKKSNKSDLSVRKVLAHQSRLKSWIPYYQESQKKNGKYRNKTFSKDSSASYPNRIPGSDLFLHRDYKEKKIDKMITKSELYPEEKYVYSGLSFYLFPDLVERISGLPFDQYLALNYYDPLGAETLTFNPLDKYSKSRIVPTEVDTFFRMTQLHGAVHDEGAAVMLGISGNAGLFSNSIDLAKVYQMLLNGGEYNGITYLSNHTISTFTACQYCNVENRRGLGFDKPLIAYDSIKSSVAREASPYSFGHSGYTGTLVWADPANDLLFVFLSNRVHPTRENRKIYQLNIRPRIHNLVYELLNDK